MKIRLPEKESAWLIAAFIRLLALTLRVRITDPNGFLTGEPRGPFIVAVWHNRILGLVIAGRHRPRILPMAVLTSASRDGALLSEVMVQFGLDSVRGSSSRKGAVALLQMIKAHDAGRTLIITPDGPRGPRYQLSPGVILLAQKTGAPVLAVHVHFSRAWRLKTWDGFYVPMPFSKIEVVIDPAKSFEGTSGNAEFESQRSALEQNLSESDGD